MQIEVLLSAITECNGLCLLDNARLLLLLSGLEGINALELELAGGQCFVAGFGKAHICNGAKAHISFPAIHCVAVDPGSIDQAIGAGCTLQVQSTAVAMPADWSVLDEAGSQAHRFLRLTFNPPPVSPGKTRFAMKVYERLRQVSSAGWSFPVKLIRKLAKVGEKVLKRTLPPPERSSPLFATVHKTSIFPVLSGDNRLYVSATVRYNPTNCCGKLCRIGRKVQYGGRSPKLSSQPTNGRRDSCRTSSID